MVKVKKIIAWLTKFRQIPLGKYCTMYLFQRGRWELGFTLDINGGITMETDWSTWLFSIDLIYISFEFSNPQNDD